LQDAEQFGQGIVNSFPSCAAAEGYAQQLFESNSIITNIVNLVNTAKDIFSEAKGSGAW